jgi:hypothetical protein
LVWIIIHKKFVVIMSELLYYLNKVLSKDDNVFYYKYGEIKS